jgi:hypothetical protein
MTMPNKPPRDKQLRPRTARPRTAGDLLQRVSAGGTLAAVRQSASGAPALRQRLLTQLPETLGSHIATVIVKPGEVVVFVDAAAWAARLKIALAERRPDLKPEAADESRITVRVMPTGAFRR